MTPEKREPPHDDWMLVNSDPALDRLEPSLTSAEGFDLIRKQKEDIQEERKMYLELILEHDDLLALLAQHDLECACLKEALSEAIGEDAVDEGSRREVLWSVWEDYQSCIDSHLGGFWQQSYPAYVLSLDCQLDFTKGQFGKIIKVA
jgi:hypothetical protein